MAEGDFDSPDDARSRLLELLEADDWEFSDRARNEGKVALRWLHNRTPTDLEMVDYLLSLLKSRTTLRRTPQGDPPGSTGIAWQMTDSRKVFVKLRIRERRIGQEYAYIQSIHGTVHARKK